MMNRLDLLAIPEGNHFDLRSTDGPRLPILLSGFLFSEMFRQGLRGLRRISAAFDYTPTRLSNSCRRNHEIAAIPERAALLGFGYVVGPLCLFHCSLLGDRGSNVTDFGAV